VHHSACVRRAQAFRDLTRERNGALDRRTALAQQQLAQRVTAHELHHEIRCPAVDSGIVNRDDVRVRERGERANLARESDQILRSGPRVHQLHGNFAFAAELGVARTVDGPHAAAADQRPEHVAPELARRFQLVVDHLIRRSRELPQEAIEPVAAWAYALSHRA
jgi:hypothetical protein